MADLLEEIEIADQVGLDVFGMGEHHRAEFLDSAPAIILAAAAARTKTIRLTSAVTVLSAPQTLCACFREFATLDLISKGRAEIVVGRGSFGERLSHCLASTRGITMHSSPRNWISFSRSARYPPSYLARAAFRPSLTGAGCLPTSPSAAPPGLDWSRGYTSQSFARAGARLAFL